MKTNSDKDKSFENTALIFSQSIFFHRILIAFESDTKKFYFVCSPTNKVNEAVEGKDGGNGPCRLQMFLQTFPNYFLYFSPIDS